MSAPVQQQVFLLTNHTVDLVEKTVKTNNIYRRRRAFNFRIY